VKLKSVIGEDVDDEGNTMPKCDPGMKGCVLYGRFRFSNEAKNKPSKSDEGAED